MFNVSGRISGKCINCIKWIKDFFFGLFINVEKETWIWAENFCLQIFLKEKLKHLAVYICAYLISGIRQNYWPAGYPAESVSVATIHLMRFINIKPIIRHGAVFKVTFFLSYVCPVSVFTKELILSALVSCSSRRTKSSSERRSRTLIWRTSARKR